MLLSASISISSANSVCIVKTVSLFFSYQANNLFMIVWQIIIFLCISFSISFHFEFRCIGIFLGVYFDAWDAFAMVRKENASVQGILMLFNKENMVKSSSILRNQVTQVKGIWKVFNIQSNRSHWIPSWNSFEWRKR